MKGEVKVSVVQFACELLQLEKNIRRISEFVEVEAKAGQELIVFPELVNIGEITPRIPGDPVGIKGMTHTQFATTYVQAAETIPGPTTEALSKLTRKYGVYVIVGMAEKHATVPAIIYNSGVLIGPKGVIGVHHKMHLPLIEKTYFCAGNEARVFQTELGCIGIEVCYDSRFPELSRMLALKGAEIICCVFASFDKVTPSVDGLYHRAFVRAEENGVFFINAAGTGQQGDIRLTGHSAVAAPDGSLIAVSDTDKEEVIRTVLKKDDLMKYRSTRNMLRDRRPELYELISTPVLEEYNIQNTTESRSGEEGL